MPALLFLVLSALSGAAAETGDRSGAWQGKQEAQQRARGMARDLISGILDVQLKQLRENRLEKTPLYGEISSMRNHIDALVETEMHEVVELLVQMQGLSEARQRQNSVHLREKIRQIVVRLSVERHALLRRLQMSDVSAKVQRLIAAQSAVLNVTDTLSAKQENRALAAIREQSEVKDAYLELIESLGEVSGWGGVAGTGATDGLKLLKETRVGQELDNARAAMEAVQFPAAAASQRAAMKGLTTLLDRVEQARGLIQADREAVVQKVQNLSQRQEELRDKTGQAPLVGSPAEKLVQQQSALQKDLDRLADRLTKVPGAVQLVDKAKTAAFDAVAELFDGRQKEALAEQEKVLANLASLQQHLLKAGPIPGETGATDRLGVPDRRGSPATAVRRGSPDPAVRRGSPDPAETADRKVSAADGRPPVAPVARSGDRPQPAGDRPQPAGDRPQPIGDRPQPIGDRPQPIGDRPQPIGDRPRPSDFQAEPWFAKLPPDVRKAIEARSQRRAPRGYEERLQRYFQNVD